MRRLLFSRTKPRAFSFNFSTRQKPGLTLTPTPASTSNATPTPIPGPGPVSTATLSSNTSKTNLDTIFQSTHPNFELKRMAPLNAASEAAIARLRSYVPPPTAYSSVPLSRRAAVLILLYADAKGDLKVVVTIRAKTLRSYAGEAALPGGRADSLQETPFQTARREASEEIGLPENTLLPPFRVEHLCELPANLAKTEVVVRPCVALLHGYDAVTGLEADPEVSLIPTLDAREVAAVFTAGFRDFLSIAPGGDEEWYRGSWSLWHDSQWRMHQFFVPKQTIHRSTASTVKVEGDLDLDSAESRYRVFGMTARMLVDAARVAYVQEPEFEHNSHFGDEAMIAKLRRFGRLSAVRKASDGLTRETMEKASKLS